MERFLRQHAGVTTADGLMLYDNSDEDSPGCAWAIQTQEERDEQERDDRTRRADHPHRRP
jgi:hypothetical protein